MSDPVILLAALLQPAVAPATPADIAPPLGVVVRHTSVQQRDDGRTRRTFRIARDIVFAADGDGFRATVTLQSATADAPPGEVENYRRANAPMLGRPVAIRLDRAGRLRTVEDQPAVWAAWSQGLAATRATRPGPETDAVRERLRALPADRVAAMIGSMVTELVVPAAERRPAAARPVSLASPPPFAAATLTGTAVAVPEGSGLRIRLAASGTAPAGPGRPEARIGITVTRLADIATGLYRASVRTERTSAPGLTLAVTNTSELTW